MSARRTRIEQTIAALRTMSAAQLRARYLEVFGEPSGREGRRHSRAGAGRLHCIRSRCGFSGRSGAGVS